MCKYTAHDISVYNTRVLYTRRTYNETAVWWRRYFKYFHRSAFFFLFRLTKQTSFFFYFFSLLAYMFYNNAVECFLQFRAHVSQISTVENSFHIFKTTTRLSASLHLRLHNLGQYNLIHFRFTVVYEYTLIATFRWLSREPVIKFNTIIPRQNFHHLPEYPVFWPQIIPKTAILKFERF